MTAHHEVAPRAADDRARVVLLTRRIPYPPDRDGGSKVAFQFIDHLSARFAIDLIIPVASGETLEEAHMDALRPYCRSIATFAYARPRWRRAAEALFHPRPLVFHLYSKRHYRKHIHPVLAATSEGARAVIVQDSHLAPFADRFPVGPGTARILMLLDYYTLVYERTLAESRSPSSRVYNWLAWRKLLRWEPRIYRRFDSVVFLTSEDRRFLAARHPALARRVAVIPPVVEGPPEASTPFSGDTAERPTLLFTGNMGYEPNRQAVAWFRREVLPGLQRLTPVPRLQIVGRAAERLVPADHPLMTVHGDVPSLWPYIKAATLVISPLRSGAGIKNKVLEAMVCGKAVLGTPLSFDGIPAEPGVHAMMASSASEWVAGIERALASPALRDEIGARAMRLVEMHFAPERFVSRWVRLIEQGPMDVGD